MITYKFDIVLLYYIFFLTLTLKELYLRPSGFVDINRFEDDDTEPPLPLYVCVCTV